MPSKWVKTFIEVVESGGFGAAASRSFQTQSAVSAHVAALERQVGVQLFDRSTKPAQLTDAGRLYYDKSVALMSEWARAGQDAREVASGMHGRVCIASYPSVCAAFLPNVLTIARRQIPDLALQVIELRSVELDDARVRWDTDMVIRQTFPAPPNTHQLHRIDLWQETLVLVVPKHHHVAVGTKISVDLRRVVGEPIITTGRGATQGPAAYETNAALERAGLEAELSLDASQPQTLIAWVSAGLGIGVTNSLAIAMADSSAVEVRQLDDVLALRKVALYVPTERLKSKAVQKVIKLIVEAELPHGVLPVASN
jgi:DNA-binding transcriptional LysR family regulator